jgi:predicted dehydrogenase
LAERLFRLARLLGKMLGANDRINVGLIGIGSRGTDHLDLLLERREEKRDIEIVALCDVYQKRLNATSAKVPGAKTYAHHQELLDRKDIEAIFIATPDHWHVAITLAAMEGGKDVYVEKPMTHTVEESKTVAHRAKELQRVVQVGVQALSWNRWHKIRDVVQSGMIGQVVAVQGYVQLEWACRGHLVSQADRDRCRGRPRGERRKPHRLGTVAWSSSSHSFQRGSLLSLPQILGLLGWHRHGPSLPHRGSFPCRGCQ